MNLILTFIYIILGGILGASLDGEFGNSIIGVFLGLIFGLLTKLFGKISDLETKLSAHGTEQDQKPSETVFLQKSLVEDSKIEKPIHPVFDNIPILESAKPAIESKTEYSKCESNAKETREEEFTFSDWMLQFLNNMGIARIGVILLFLGVAFLLKYTADKGYFSIEMRLIASAIGSLVLIAIGWKVRKRNKTYGLILEGGGIGIFYLTVFISSRLYGLLPDTLTFKLMVLACAFSAMLSFIQSSKSLALLGVTGGFLAPFLATTGHFEHSLLFSYYAAINISIFAISYLKHWNRLNIVGFVFTLLFSLFWSIKFYKPMYFDSFELFLILFFALYCSSSLFFEIRRIVVEPQKMKGTIIFSLPFVAFFLQSRLVENNFDWLSISAIALGLCYTIAAWLLSISNNQAIKPLSKAYLSLGILFLTLAIPFTFSGQWTSIIWLAEGLALYCIGIKQNQPLTSYSAIILQLLAIIALIPNNIRDTENILPILNPFYFKDLFFAFCLGITSYLMGKRYEKMNVPKLGSSLKGLFFVLALSFWFLGGSIEIIFSADTWYSYFYPSLENNDLKNGFASYCFIIFLSISLLFFQAMSCKLKWAQLGKPRLVFIPFLAILTFFLYKNLPHPFENIGLIAWVIAFSTQYGILKYEETRNKVELNYLNQLQHHFSLWFLTFILSWESYWLLNHFVPESSIWSITSLSIIPCLIAFLALLSMPILKWPFKLHAYLYLKDILLPILFWSIVWMLKINCSDDGNPSPLPYLPILNPIDIAQLFVFLVLTYWFKEISQYLGPKGRKVLSERFSNCMAMLIFIWLTALLLRTLHFYADVPWNIESLWQSNVVQTTLSIFWSLIAFGLMFHSSHRALRTQWMIGAFLLGIVVIKLFIIDLSKLETISRIISFIGTGILLLLIAYFAPIPKDEKKKFTESESDISDPSIYSA